MDRPNPRDVSPARRAAASPTGAAATYPLLIVVLMVVAIISLVAGHSWLTLGLALLALVLSLAAVIAYLQRLTMTGGASGESE